MTENARGSRWFAGFLLAATACVFALTFVEGARFDVHWIIHPAIALVAGTLAVLTFFGRLRWRGIADVSWSRRRHRDA